MRCGRRQTRFHSISAATVCAVIVAMLFAAGCVRRTVTITSEPPGALCWINGREVGRTPVTVDFLHYGEYDVQLVATGYEPLLTSGDAKSPWWDTIPLDLAAEAVPGEPHAQVRWHYVMEPQLSDRGQLVERAEALREKLLSEAPAPPATAPSEGPADASGAATQPDVSLTPAPTTQPQSQPPSQPPATVPNASPDDDAGR
jgi:hypothetical protein